MKKIILISIVSISLLSLVSCKKEQTNNENVDKIDQKEVAKQNFNVQVQASSSIQDDFALYFTEDGTVDFNGKNAVWSGIKGGNNSEIVNFELSEDIIPTHIRLDFGLKNNQDSVVVKNVKVNFYENSFEFIGSDFFKYFIEDKQFNTKIDVAKGTLTLLKKDGAYKTPYFYPTQLTIDNIKKITTNK